MKKILSLLVVFILSFSISNAEELNTDQLSSLVADTQSLTIEKQLVGIVGAISLSTLAIMTYEKITRKMKNMREWEC